MLLELLLLLELLSSACGMLLELKRLPSRQPIRAAAAEERRSLHHPQTRTASLTQK